MTTRSADHAGTPRRPPRAAVLGEQLADARRCLARAMASTDLAERYASAHLAALRGAAAVLAAYPRPQSRTVRFASAWVQLDRLEPQLAGWSAYFAAGSAKRKAAEAGITRLISVQETDELIRHTADFLELIDQAHPVAA